MHALEEKANVFFGVQTKDEFAIPTMCPAHSMATNFQLGNAEKFDLEVLKGHEHLIDALRLGETPALEKIKANMGEDYGKERILTQLPPAIFERLTNLVGLDLTNQRISQLPSGLGQCKGLKYLYLKGNPIKEFPSDVTDLPALRDINISNTKISSIPQFVYNCGNLRALLADNTAVDSISTDAKNWSNLRMLMLNSTRVTSLPYELGDCQNLEELGLSGVPWVHRDILHWGTLSQIYDETPAMQTITKLVIFTHLKLHIYF